MATTNYCEICNIYFQTYSALKSNQKSKNHLTRLYATQPPRKHCEFCGLFSGTVASRKFHEQYCNNNPNRIEIINDITILPNERFYNTSKEFEISNEFKEEMM